MASVSQKKKNVPTTEKLQNIKVMVRVRPLSKAEEEMHVKCNVKCVSQREILAKDKKFHFDRVFKPDTEQIDVYKAVVSPMIPDIIAGYNCTIFAYGPTGSGKTYTMTGDTCECIENWQTDRFAGCIPRAAAHIFEELSTLEKNEINVKVSYIELYNEELRDLLSDDESLLPIFNDNKGSIFIQGLTEVTVHDSEGLCKQLQKGIIKRQTAPTLMNHQSSRSHTVFTITIHSRETTISGEDILKSGKINLVDLAGSENIARSGCKDMRAVELANINKSLLTLGRVIQALADKAPKHVPYRDSKLTRILQDSLGGHTKTAIIATISPAASCYDETVNTLDYASRARDIKNTPTVNEKLTKTQMIQGLLNEIDRLQRDLDAARDKSGFYVNKDNYQKLLDSVELVTGEKMSMEELNRKQSARIKELEGIMETKLKEFDDTVDECKKSKDMLHRAKKILKEKKERLKQECFVSEAYEATSGDLHKDVQQLMATTKTLAEEKEILQNKLDEQININIANESIGRTAVNEVLQLLDRIKEDHKKLRTADIRVSGLCREDVEDLKVTLEKNLDVLQQALCEYTQNNLKQLALKETMEKKMETYMATIAIRATNLQDELEVHRKHLRDFETIDIPTFQSHFQDVLKTFINGIFHIYQTMEQAMREEDTDIVKAMEELEEKIRVGNEEFEALYRKRKANDANILSQVDNCKRLILSKREKRSEEFLESIKRREQELMSLVGKMMKAAGPERAHPAPDPCKAGEILVLATTMRREVTEDLSQLELRQSEANEQIINQLGETLTQNLSTISDVLGKKVNEVNVHIDEMVDDRQKFEVTFEEFAQKAADILTKGFLVKVVPPKHVGDTPLRKPVVMPKPKNPEPREALIKRFLEQRRSRGEEDKENIPTDLNISSTHTSFRTSDSDIDLGGNSPRTSTK